MEVETFKVGLVLLELLPGDDFEPKSVLLSIALLKNALVVGLVLSENVKLCYHVSKL